MPKINWDNIRTYFIIAGMVGILFFIVTNITKDPRDAEIERMNKNITELTLKINKNGLDVQGVKNIIMKYRNPDSVTLDQAIVIAEEIVSTANKYENVSIPLLTSLVYRESKFNNRARSPRGALGLTQVMPETAVWICKEWNVNYTSKTRLDPIWSIRAGAWYLDWLYKNTEVAKQDIELSLAYYNGGGRQAYRYNLYNQSYKR